MPNVVRIDYSMTVARRDAPHTDARSSGARSHGRVVRVLDRSLGVTAALLATSRRGWMMLGQVMRPGFVTIAPDILLSDVIMLAGGPTADADLQRTSIRRGADLRVSEADARAAIRDGWTLDALDVQAGDEVVVGKRKSTNWNQIFTTSIMALGAVATVVALTQ